MDFTSFSPNTTLYLDNVDLETTPRANPMFCYSSLLVKFNVVAPPSGSVPHKRFEPDYVLPSPLLTELSESEVCSRNDIACLGWIRILIAHEDMIYR